MIKHILDTFFPKLTEYSSKYHPDRGYRQVLDIVCDAGYEADNKKNRCGIGIWIPEYCVGITLQGTSEDSNTAEMWAVLLSSKIAVLMHRKPSIASDCMAVVSYLTESPSTRKLDRCQDADTQHKLWEIYTHRLQIAKEFNKVARIRWLDRSETKMGHYLALCAQRDGNYIVRFTGNNKAVLKDIIAVGKRSLSIKKLQKKSKFIKSITPYSTGLVVTNKEQLEVFARVIAYFLK
jgi:hypothetical protein